MMGSDVKSKKKLFEQKFSVTGNEEETAKDKTRLGRDGVIEWQNEINRKKLYIYLFFYDMQKRLKRDGVWNFARLCDVWLKGEG